MGDARVFGGYPMTVRIKASPDSNNIIRIVCGGAEIEIEVVSPNTGPVFGPIDPSGDFSPMWMTADSLAPFLGSSQISRERIGVASVKLPRWARLDPGGLANQLRRNEQVDVLRLVSPRLDVHEIDSVAHSLGRNRDGGAPVLLVDMASLEELD